MAKNLPVLESAEKQMWLVPATTEHLRELLLAMEGVSAKNLQFFADDVTREREIAYLTRMEESPTDHLFLIDGNVHQDGESPFVGTIGLHEYDAYHRTARFGILVFQHNRRKMGFGSEAIQLLLRYAFETLGVNKVYGKVFEENILGRTFYARLGFLQEGRLRQEYLLDGVFHDMVYISMTRSDWDALRARHKEVA